MPCSAITLSLATTCAIVSVALLAIAFGTDNWQFIRVNRIKIETNIGRSDINPDDFFTRGLYYTRTRGLFKTCYPEELPPGENLYLSLIETRCQNQDYFFMEDVSQFSDDEKIRLHLARAVIGVFAAAFFFVFVAFFTGIVGCWKRSPRKITVTAFLMLAACLSAAGAMGLWHGVEYYEEERIRADPFQGSWDDLLLRSSSVYYDWSYMLAWVGTGMAVLSFCLFLGASHCMQSEQKKEQSKHMQYMMPVYAQKQQYPNYGYGYPAPAYPYAAPQYGHYNY